MKKQLNATLVAVVFGVPAAFGSCNLLAGAIRGDSGATSQVAAASEVMAKVGECQPC